MTRTTDASGSSDAGPNGGANVNDRVPNVTDSAPEASVSGEPAAANGIPSIIALSLGGEKLLNAVEALVADINSIIFALDVMEKSLEPRLTESFESLIEFFKKYGPELQLKHTETNSFRIEMSRTHTAELQDIFRKRATVETGNTTLMSALLLSLVSHWDKFISQVLAAIFEINPGILDNSSKSMTVSDIIQYDSLQEARQHIIDSEIESVVRENHVCHFTYIEKRLGMRLMPSQDTWHTFLELMERRNLLAHTGGMISRSYLKNCSSYGITLSGENKPGERVRVDKLYLDTACDCLTEIGIELMHAICRKNLPKEQGISEQAYHRSSYGLIEEGRCAVAIKLLEFSLVPPMKYERVPQKWSIR